MEHAAADGELGLETVDAVEELDACVRRERSRSRPRAGSGPARDVQRALDADERGEFGLEAAALFGSMRESSSLTSAVNDTSRPPPRERGRAPRANDDRVGGSARSAATTPDAECLDPRHATRLVARHRLDAVASSHAADARIGSCTRTRSTRRRARGRRARDVVGGVQPARLAAHGSRRCTRRRAARRVAQASATLDEEVRDQAGVRRPGPMTITSADAIASSAGGYAAGDAGSRCTRASGCALTASAPDRRVAAEPVDAVRAHVVQRRGQHAAARAEQSRRPPRSPRETAGRGRRARR